MRITTSNIKATDTTGRKIRARAEDGREITRPYPHETTMDPHAFVASELVGGPVREIGEHAHGYYFRTV